jgi:DhnA family fructose-bisphosphate aldolase class Ia
MTGHDIRFGKLFAEGKNAVIVAVDHGEFFGPMPGILDLPQAIGAAAEADGILLSPGMIGHCRATFQRRGAPLAILRLNWSTVYCFQWDYHAARTTKVISPQQALALGADLALASLTLTMCDEQRDRDNVAIFAELAQAKREAGIPLIGEFYPVSPEKLSPEELHQQVYFACRVVSELGADAIKTFYTGERFDEVTGSCPVPIFALGAEKTPREIDALNLAHKAVQRGARGVVFGRNVIQAADPARFLAALKAVVKEGILPSDAAREQGIETQ